MTKIGLLAVVGIVAVSQIGCGSDGGGGGGGGSAPDFVALEGKLTQPSGTFSAGQESAVQDGFSGQSTAAAGNPFGGSGGSGSTSTKSAGLHPLGDGPTSCAALGSGGGKGHCDCPNGGSLDFDIPDNISGNPGQDTNGAIDQTVSIVAATCGMSADETVDGSVYWKIKNPPMMQLFSVHLRMTGKQAAAYDVDYLDKDGIITFAVEVADGRVLVSAKGNWDKDTKTGTLVITDKDATWTCVMTNGKGTCTSSDGTSRAVGS